VDGPVLGPGIEEADLRGATDMDRIDTTAFAAPDRTPDRTLGGTPGGMSLSAVPVTTAAMARAHVRAVVLERWNSPSRRATEAALIDLLLVVSELTANAIRHGDGLAGFEVTLTREGVRLTVHDNSDVIPAAVYGSGRLPPVQHGNGYGWPLIIRLSREIAVDRRPGGGKTIRVLVPLQTSP
jgi:anti-sigma regulatory factor (Ser/Thr protein kinase)